jgi:hypothetical protein
MLGADGGLGAVGWGEATVGGAGLGVGVAVIGAVVLGGSGAGGAETGFIPNRQELPATLTILPEAS